MKSDRVLAIVGFVVLVLMLSFFLTRIFSSRSTSPFQARLSELESRANLTTTVIAKMDENIRTSFGFTENKLGILRDSDVLFMQQLSNLNERVSKLESNVVTLVDKKRR